MRSRNLNLQLGINIILIIVTAFFLGYLQDESPWISFLLVLILIFIVYRIIEYSQKPIHDLQMLMESIRFEDFTLKFNTAELDPSKKELYNQFNNLLHVFRQTRLQAEENRIFLQQIVQHIGTPVIAFDETGNIALINTAAKKLWEINYLKTLQDLDKIAPGWEQNLTSMKANARFILGKSGLSKQLAGYASRFILGGKNIKLVTLVDISRELDTQELDSWSQLLKVLTHEIMNSITPISSLASTIHDTLRETKDSVDPKSFLHAIEAIERRSKGLNQFIHAFRDLTIFPKPQFQKISVQNLFDRLERLMLPTLQSHNIGLQIIIEPSSLQLTADVSMLEQALLNLIKNATEALSNTHNGKILLSGKMEEKGHIQICIKDNGPGILAEVADQIFIPFFTTKNNGSGIGLSLVKRMMQAHHGHVVFQPPAGGGAQFCLIFDS